MWIRCLRGERLLTASYGLRPNLNKRSFSPNEEGSRLFVACFLHTSRRYTFDLDKESTHGQPASCRARPVNVDGGLEDIRWISGLGGDKLSPVFYALLPNLKKRSIFCHQRGIKIFFTCFLHSSTRMCFYQTSGRRPPRITGRLVNTVIRGWVGAPNERAPFIFHSAVVIFVDRCLSKTRNSN